MGCMRKILIPVITLVVWMMCMSIGAEEAALEYELFTSENSDFLLLEDGTVQLCKYSGNDVILAIPSEVNGYTVSSIGDSAFSYADTLCSVAIPDSVISVGKNPFVGCTNLRSIFVSEEHPTLTLQEEALIDKTDQRLICMPAASSVTQFSIPEGIQRIGEDAFSYCTNLTDISIPDSITSIDEGSFSCCIGLTEITIPDSVTFIGVNPFYNCSNLKDITISPDHSSFEVIRGALFRKEDKQLICFPGGLIQADYSIPEGTLIIGDLAFCYCSSLNMISIPDSVVSINSGAFYKCSSLASITLPDHEIEMGGFVFAGCASLTEVHIPDGSTSIGEGMFMQCINLTSVEIPDSVTVIAYGAFAACESLTVIVIPDSVQSIGEDAFIGCNALTVTVTKDGYAHQYCIRHGVPYTFAD